MWIAKGLLLGTWLFSFGTIASVGIALYRYMVVSRTTIPPGHSGTIPPDFFTRLTVSNSSWWLALVACLSIALIVTHSWSGKPILWIGLAVTELVPVVLLAWILVPRNQVPGFGYDPDWAKKGPIIQNSKNADKD